MRLMKSALSFVAILFLYSLNGAAFAQTSATDCKLDANNVFIGAKGTSSGLPQVMTGKTYRLELFERQGPAIRNVAPACFEWQFDKQDGVSFDVLTGLLQVMENGASGKSVRIGAQFADLSLGHATHIHEEIPIFRIDENPLVGIWREAPQTRCLAKNGDQALDQINELEFRSNGSFSVTWRPFESYVDYWGRYEFNKLNSMLVLSIERGNFVPAAFQGAGSFEISPDGMLRLKGIWLGSKLGAKAVDDVECGRSFELLKR
jgi:hypothetical protein